MQYIPLEYNNNMKHSGMVLRSNGMLLSHFKRNPDAIPPHPTPPQALVTGLKKSELILPCDLLLIYRAKKSHMKELNTFIQPIKIVNHEQFVYPQPISELLKFA
jgi:hypothetical protein